LRSLEDSRLLANGDADGFGTDDGMRNGWRRARTGERRLEAAERFVEATCPAEGSSETCQISDRLSPTVVRVGVIDVDPAQETGQRPDILTVVANDIDQRPGLAAPQEIEIEPRDLPAVDVLVADRSEELGLDRSQPRVGHPMAKDAAHERQQVEMAGERRRRQAGHPITRDE